VHAKDVYLFLFASVVFTLWLLCVGMSPHSFCCIASKVGGGGIFRLTWKAFLLVYRGQNLHPTPPPSSIVLWSLCTYVVEYPSNYSQKKTTGNAKVLFFMWKRMLYLMCKTSVGFNPWTLNTFIYSFLEQVERLSNTETNKVDRIWIKTKECGSTANPQQVKMQDERYAPARCRYPQTCYAK